ncbi:hypothetical protein H7X46_26390 [Pseudonocardia sp. C8]|uniref:hypothetical protein n=1 Tax=Pseudonocardia sp. C8 TaxID=2762759 RepID=UPI00164329BE|nr:hypothetical protein [Pseudonocardia sp. C8]MBC3194583.1 hypothetical protein [Pseudonocardia sp. C8]
MGSDGAAGDLRSRLVLAGMDCAERLSSQVDGVIERALVCPDRVADPAWWAAALEGPAREFDDGWDRRCGPVLRRTAATRSLLHRRMIVMEITHAPSRSAGPVLAAAAAAALPRSGARARRSASGRTAPAASRIPYPTGPRARAGRRARGAARPARSAGGRVPGAGITGAVVSGAVVLPGGLASGPVLSGSVLSGSVLSGLAGAGRVLPAAGPGLLLVLAGLVLLAGAGIAARLRAVRAARARAIAVRVRAAVLAAADRELIRRTLDAERAAGTGRAG